MSKHILLSAVFAFICSSAFAQLNGTYSVNAAAPASATNYQSVTAAVSDLSTGTRPDGGPVNGPGVTGPVTIRIVAGSGPYNEQVIIPAITGASAINTIRISGNSTRETITYAASTTTDRAVVKLNNADYVTIDSLTLINTSTIYSVGVHLTATADYNTISNCIITVDSTGTTANNCGIQLAGNTPTTAGDNGDYNTFSNNMVYGGYYGISINGINTTTFDLSNTISNNTFKGFYYYGIRCYEQTDPVVTGNTIHARIAGTTAGYGAYLYYNTQLTFTGNKILRAGQYSIYTAYQNTLLPLRSTVANNFVCGSLNVTTPYGIYVTTSSNNVDVVYNSISQTSGNGRCIYILSGSGNTVQNNSMSIVNSTTGYALYISATTYVTTVDYNNFWAPGSSNFIYIGVAYTTGTFVGGGGYNTNSINVDPYYTNPVNNLHLYANSLSNVGTNVGITTDIDGDARPSNGGYDIGADEYTPLTDDVGVISVLTPESYTCASSSAPVEVVIASYGTTPVTSVNLTAAITGFTTATLNFAWTGSLSFGQRDTVTIGTFSTLPGGTLTIEAYAVMAGDQNPDNDTTETARVINILGTPAVGTNDTVCSGDSTSLSVVTDGLEHVWYDSLTGGTALTSGDLYNTGPVTSTTTYYVESYSQISNNIVTTYANNNSCGGGNMFDIVALTDILIDSFACNLSAGTSTVDVYYKIGTHIGSETNAGAWTLLGSATVTSTGTGGPTYVPVGGLSIPNGQTYGIFLAGPSFVYTTLTVSTTYANSDLQVICGTGLCGLFSGTNYPRGWNGTVFYTADGCPSATRTPVTVSVVAPPVVNLGADTAACNAITLDAGNPGESFLWSTGDITQTTVASSSGNYSVGVTNAYCPTVYDTLNFTLNPPPTLSVSSAFGAVCAGNSDTLMVNGASTYSWSTGGTTSTEVVTPAASMYYYVTGTDSNGCVNTDSIMVTVNALPNVTLSLPMDTFCLGTGSVTLSGESPSGGTFSGPAVTGNMFNVDTAGIGTHTILYMYTDSNGCASMDSQMVMVDPCLFVNDVNTESFSVYPNPNNGTFTVVLGENRSEMRFVLYNAMGETVMSFTLNATTTTFTNEVLPAGIYMLNGTGEQRSFTRTIVVQ